jgi:hypothetical protein
MKLTKIYVKQSPLGLMYLGKTTLNNHDSYLGSGKYWKLHIKKHNLHHKDIKTWVLHETDARDDLIKIGLYYSKLFNIVDSKNWANLKQEAGDGGVTVKNQWVGEKNPFFNKGYKQLGEKNPMYKKGYLISGEKHPLYGKKNPKWAEIGKRKRKAVDQFDLNGNFIKRWDGMREAAKCLDICHTSISSICRNQQESINGYTFKYSKQKI